MYGDVTTGAENDLEQATSIARQMVGRWGMSEAIGPVSVLPDPRTEPHPALDGSGPAPGTRELVDAEVRRILEECYCDALETLRQHRDALERLTRALLEAETLDAEQAQHAAALPSGAETPVPATDDQPPGSCPRPPSALPAVPA